MSLICNARGMYLWICLLPRSQVLMTTSLTRDEIAMSDSMKLSLGCRSGHTNLSPTCPELTITPAASS